MGKNQIVHKIAQLAAHQQSIYAIDGDAIVFFTAGADKSVIRWDWNNFEKASIVCKTNSTIYSILALPSSILAVGTSSGLLHFVNLETKEEVKCLQLDGSIFSIIYRSNSNQIYAATAKGTLYIIDAETYEFIKIISVGKDKIRSMDICETRQIIALACSDTFVYILNLIDFSLIKSFKAHEWACNVVKFHPENTQLFTASKDAHIHIWNLKTFNLEKSIPAHNFAIYSLDFIENGRFFITSGRDKTVKLWNTEKTEVITRFYKNLGGHTHSVNSQFWNAQKNQLVTVGDDRKILVWKVNTNLDSL